MKTQTMAKNLLRINPPDPKNYRLSLLLSGVALFLSGMFWDRNILPVLPEHPPAPFSILADTLNIASLTGDLLMASLVFMAIFFVREAFNTPPDMFERINQKSVTPLFLSLLAGTWALTVFPAPWLINSGGLDLPPESRATFLALPALVASALSTHLMGKRQSVALSLITGLSFSILFHSPSWTSVFIMIGCIFTGFATALFRGRIGFIKSGTLTGLFLFLMELSSHLYWTPSSPFELLGMLVTGLSTGLLSALGAVFLLPLLERGFGVLSDMALTELLDVNHPLLREFYLKAPGSYQHSMSLAYLSEAAATSIGENPKLARISAYYHDIGKMERPQYFIENQAAYNRHELLTPRMSAIILIDHVRRGIEIGHRFHLPQTVIDAIPEHHGTRLMQFFYRKAFEQESEDHKMGPDSDFRYPGPKPRSKITAIIMLADAVEAAGRVLQRSSPTPARIQGMIEDVFSDIIKDGQLDESPLTLEEIANIKKTFTQILVSIYHHRIPYPKATPPGQKKNFPERSQGALNAR